MPSSLWSSRLRVRALAPLACEFGQCGVVRRVLVEHPRNGLQPVVLWFWQLQWLLVCFVELIDEDSTKASARGAFVVACDVVVVGWAGEGEQNFAGEVGGGEHGRMG